MFKVYANTLESTQLADIGARAARAEKMGYWGMHVPDAVHDGLLLSALALNATENLVVGTSVMVAFPRSPMITAIAAWDLQRMSGGRFELGLGTQIKANIEKRYSARWDSPVPQLREYMQAIKAVHRSFQTGEKLDFQGDHYTLTKLQPFFNPGPIDGPPVPVFAGAVGPAMTRMVGKIADGAITHPTNTAPEYLEQVYWPRLREGLNAAGRGEESFDLVVGPLCATGPTEEAVDAEWGRLRGMLAFLYSTPAYWPSLELYGWKDKGEQLLDLSRQGKWQEMAAVVTDEVMDKVVPRGTYDQIANIFMQRYGELTDRVLFPMPDNPADDEAVSDVIRKLQETSSREGQGQA